MSELSNQKKAVVLLSGGLDSYTTAAIAKEDGFEIYAISFDYGQRHRFELEGAKKIALSLKVKQHLVQVVDLRSIGGSALTDDIAVPDATEGTSSEIPVTYVPARNTIFLSLALAWAEVLGAESIFIGANAVDYSGYPDCRPEFIESFEKMANLATRVGVQGGQIKVSAPLMELSKSEIIKKGISLGLDYSLTISCYNLDQSGHACGKCDSCRLRRNGFKEADVPDPTIYSQPKQS
ncbi:MAG: 7-cyano-7-deazaguanine synthase QueC [bacterium]|nr:7-cyano-7-deazaguanine synthase QueC [bacterium]